MLPVLRLDRLQVTLRQRQPQPANLAQRNISHVPGTTGANLRILPNKQPARERRQRPLRIMGKRDIGVSLSSGPSNSAKMASIAASSGSIKVAPSRLVT